MDIGQGLLLGLQNAMTPGNLLACFVGVLWGTMVGVLPGLGPVGGMTMLMPLTFGMDMTQGIIMMAGIYYGSMYGGSTTSILAAVPGEVASAVTILDGHQMALKGRAGVALSLSAIGSFIAGTVGVVALSVVAPQLVAIALDFGPPEYFAIAVLGLSMSAYLGSGSLLKGVVTAALGLMVSTVGMSTITAESRFSFGLLQLSGGVEIVAVLMGIFGVAEVLETVESKVRVDIVTKGVFDFRGLMPTKQDWQDSAGPIGRGSVLGFIVGILPGAGAVVSSFLSYALEKKLSKHPEKFGTGIVEGVAGPESANNAATAGGMIPLLTLGVPYNVVTAIMLSAMVVHGIYPSPLLMEREPQFFWTVIGSMYIGNALLLVLNLPLIGVWASLLKLPFRWLFPMILVFSITGVYSINYNPFDLWIMLLFGFIGYFMKKLAFPPAPLALALVLGPLIERAMSQSLIISGGDPSIFVTRPLSGVLLAVTVLVLASPMLMRLFGGQGRVVPVENEE
jgi:putative tricarboxylic transport membrane protein